MYCGPARSTGLRWGYDVVLNFGDGEVEGLDGVRPLKTIVQWGIERRDDTMGWLSGLPDVFEDGANTASYRR